jgi:galactokinase
VKKIRKKGKVLPFGSTDRLVLAIEKEVRKAVHGIMAAMIAEVDFAKNENKEKEDIRYQKAATYSQYIRNGKAQPCHFCKRMTKREVKFGFCTYFTPCCARCEK